MKRGARSAGAPALGLARLAAQRIVRPTLVTPGEVVHWMGAVQAQDRAAAQWAVALRMARGRRADVEQALADGAILRTHAMRGTWQLVVAADIRWLLALVGPSLIARWSRWDRQLALDEATYRRSQTVFERALRGGNHLTRDELAARLEGRGVSPAGQRLAHLLARAELEAALCSGAPRGGKATYALLDERVPGGGRVLGRERGLVALAGRYFASRGPATLADFIWWSGLSTGDARAGLEAVKGSLICEEIDGRSYWRAEGPRPRGTAAAAGGAHLLPAFDEYLIAYKDRGAVLDSKYARRLNAGGGMLSPCVVVGGRVIGVWRRVVTRAATSIEIEPFEPTPAAARVAVATAARRYGEFLGAEVRLTWRAA